MQSKFIIIGISLFILSIEIQAQEAGKNVYGGFSIGYGNTFFNGLLSEKETINDERGYGRNDGMALSSFYYYAPKQWKGMGIGTGIKAFVARPNEGENNEVYSYSYYHIGLSFKHHFSSKIFNKGWYYIAQAGLGQATEKMEFGETNIYDFQTAFGYSVQGAIGYAIPLAESTSAITLDLHYEYANRRTNITGSEATQAYINNHVSFNIGLSF